MRILRIFAVFMLMTFPLIAGTINVPGDQGSIQDGLNSAYHLDTVLVAPGNYVENIDFQGRAIKLISSGGAGVTSITPMYSNIATVTFSNVSVGGAEITGFTIGGSRYTAINCSSASPVIKENIFTDNIAPAEDDQLAGAITLFRSGGTLITYNTFVGNGSGVDVANILFKECLGTKTTMNYNLIYSSISGRAEVKIDSTYLNFINNTVAAEVDYGLDLPYTAHLENNIITSAGVYGIFLHAVNGPEMYCEYNCLFGNASPANFALSGTHIYNDPLFVDAGSGDFNLSPGSPCIDAGNPDYAYYEPDNTPIDMGAFHFSQVPLPAAINLDIEGEDITHVLGHTPRFTWDYAYEGVDQTDYEIEVGTDNDWSVAEMWNSGQITNPDNFADYGGIALEDATDYYVRVRVAGDGLWGNWTELAFHMNGVPSVPENDSPQDGAAINNLNYYTFTVKNVVDPEGDAYSTHVQLFEDAGLTTLLDEKTSTGGVELFMDYTVGQSYYWRAAAIDVYGESSAWSSVWSFTLVDPCPAEAFPGDADGNGSIETADADFILDLICNSGPAPDPLWNGDLNGDCIIDTLDIMYLTDYLDGGPPPADCHCIEINIGSCESPGCCPDLVGIGPCFPGDANCDGMTNVVDASYILCWVFFGCDDPPCMAASDANADGSTGIVDASYIINYIFFGGGEPHCGPNWY